MTREVPIDRYLLARWHGPVIPSYAQNAEDVRMWRVLGHKSDGFYVDVGAGDPTLDSVTRLFYDSGWTGINLEPGPHIARLRDARPRDINLEVAIARNTGEANMAISFPDPGLSSLRPSASRLPDGISWKTKVVKTARLDDVLAEYAPARKIDFLKIDVEGLEREVLESFDLLTVRPRIVLVEAVSPLEHRPTHGEFESVLERAEYVFAAFDGVNRFYVPTEREELVPAVAYPISALDRYVKASPEIEGEASREERRPDYAEESEIERLEAALRDARETLVAMEATLSWRLTKPLRAIRRAQLSHIRRGVDRVEQDRASYVAHFELAFAARLQECSILLTADRSSVPQFRSSLDDALVGLETIVTSTSVQSRAIAWLGLLCATGIYPLEDEVEEAARVLRVEGARAFTSHLRFALEAACESETVSENDLEVVFGEVVVDVSQVASSDLHTGVQRVARETVTRWIHTHPSVRLAVFNEGAQVLRLLTSQEKERILRWQEELGTSGSPISKRRPQVSDRTLVPWGCHLVIPELPGPRRVRVLRGVVTAQVHGSLSLIGYDLIPIVAPETAPRGFGETFSQYLSLVKQADRLSAISRRSTEDFRAFAGMLASVGAAGPDVRTHPLPTVVPAVTNEDVQATHRQLELDGSALVLVVGSHEPRKNHLLVLEAAERLWAGGLVFQLAFIGGTGWKGGHGFAKLVRHLQSRGRQIVVRRRVSEHELWAAYRHARFTVFPSLVEGYGLPVAESLASGTPAITSNYGSMAEIAEGGGALLADPRSVDDLTEQMRRLLTDEDLYERLRGEALARDFGSWDDYAREVWDFFTRDATEPPR